VVVELNRLAYLSGSEGEGLRDLCILCVGKLVQYSSCPRSS
jgi:hypothetical protein